MAEQSLKKRTLNGLLWNGLQRFGALGISFIANLVLVRLLDASVFGAIGILLVFVAISQSIVDGGFTAALIQRKDVTQTDYSTVFYWNLTVSTLMVLVLYCSAPFIAEYFSEPILCNVLRVQSILLIIHALCVVQTARLTKDLSFKVLSIRTLVATFTGVIVAIVMAYNGFGIWSIVAQELTVATIGTILLWAYCNWKPSLTFSWKSFKGMFKFGSFVFLSSICETLYTNVQSIIIGRSFSITDLGYYTQAKKLETVPVSGATAVLSQVLFPAYSSINNDYDKLKTIVRKNINVITYLAFPIMLLLAIVSEPLLTILYTDKWVESIPMFQILCLGGMFFPLNVCNTMLFKALGYGKVFFILQTIKRLINLTFILLSVRYGLYAMLWAVTITQVLSYIMNLIYTHKLFNYSVTEQLADIIPNLINTLMIGGIVYYIQSQVEIDNNIIQLIIVGAMFTLLYFGTSKILKLKSIKHIHSLWK